MNGFRCRVLNATGTRAVAAAQPPVYCEDAESECVNGAKQMLYWHQKSGNNIEINNTRWGTWATPGQLSAYALSGSIATDAGFV
jgi:hypothetical protein